jgi:hypothetical protein
MQAVESFLPAIHNHNIVTAFIQVIAQFCAHTAAANDYKIHE